MWLLQGSNLADSAMVVVGSVWQCMCGDLSGVGGCCGPQLAAVWQLGDRGACMGQTSVNKACLHPNVVAAGLQSGGFCDDGGGVWRCSSVEQG